MTITRNRTSNTVVSKSIEELKHHGSGYSIAEIADTIGVSQQLVSNALQGHKVGLVNDKAAQYYILWQESEKMRRYAKQETERLRDEIATMMIPEPDTEASEKLEAVISEQADTIAVLKAALRNLI